MKKTASLNKFYSICYKEKLCKSSGDLKFYLTYLFKDIDLTGKTVLDIGAGPGTYGLYAVLAGAAKVICLEPEAAGSRSGFIKKFTKVSNALKLKNITMIATTFQQFKTTGKKFDIILLHHSINHLDEQACIKLQNNKKSQQVYKKLFKELYALGKKNSKIIITDASCHNFYPHFGLKNPFVPSIEWNKHQSPQLWAELFSKAGFKNQKITWTPPSQLRIIGSIFCSNQIASYFLHSHFRLIMSK